MYPVVQEWFQRMFSDGMWMDEVKRFGMQAVKMPKPKMWDVMFWDRTTRGNWGTGEERWNRDDGWVKKDPHWC
jgi:hypothetical protein